MIKKILITFLLLPFFFSISANSLESEWQFTEKAKLRIISPYLNTGENHEITLGLEYKLEDGWKTYWKSPGAGGFPQTIDYSESTNVNNLKILWPTPQSFSILGLHSLGYENNIIFPITINIADLYQPTLLKLKIHFLVCKDICIPGDANLSLFIPNGKEQLFSKHINSIEKYISLSPIQDAKSLNISVQNPILYNEEKKSIFEFDVIQKNQFINPQIHLDSSMGLPVEKPKIKFDENLKKLTATFFYEDTFIDLDKNDIVIHIADTPLVYEEKVKFQTKDFNEYSNSKDHLVQIIFIAILGGLILNIMPCVLPVLSIKLISVTRYSGKENTMIRRGFLSTALGIIVSFILLGVFLLLLKISGQQIGWGIQFQEPLFLMAIALILLLFSFNLIDLFEIPTPNLKILGSSNNTLFSDFITGFFATLMATPCSAPFVGTAVAFAFTQNSFLLMLTFFFMSLGMSLPYLVIAAFPDLVKFLPSSGNWMIWVRRAMSILLFLTFIWILSILNNHFNDLFIGWTVLLSSLILLFLILNKKNILKNGPSLITILFILFIYFLSSFNNFFNKNFESSKTDWNNFNQTLLENLIKEEKIVFIDITADWCITCQYNKQKVINTKEIKDLFEKFEVVKIKGDWTLPNKEIEDFLNSYNKFGIPFNIIYGKNSKEGIIFSELLTKKEIKNALNELRNDE